MTDRYIHARLAWLEQALEQMASPNLPANPKTVEEQYIARYFDDFGPLSLGIFHRELRKKS